MRRCDMVVDYNKSLRDVGFIMKATYNYNSRRLLLQLDIYVYVRNTSRVNVGCLKGIFFSNVLKQYTYKYVGT